jgi:DNA-binding NtrC family response regulator
LRLAHLQSKLLRVLQEGEFRRVGEARARRVNVRLVAASNRPLDQEVAAGRFRADLFYRLHVVTLALPPLRDRGDDIGLLVGHFIARAALAEGRAPIRLADRTLAALGHYSWPGNVRELENEIRRLTALHAGELVRVDQLANRVRAALLVTEAGVKAAPMRSGLHAAVAALERRMIAESLVERAGNKSRVARDLGLSRQGLAKKMRRYGLGFELDPIGDGGPRPGNGAAPPARAAAVGPPLDGPRRGPLASRESIS